MYYLSTSSLLQLTAGVIGLELALCAKLLARRNLFHWTTTGFWAWAAFLVYFVLSPWSVAVNESYTYKVQMLLGLSGGTERGLWVLLLIVLGIAAFFVGYLRTQFKPVTWSLPAGPLRVNLLLLFVLIAFVVFGFYSLLVFRAGLFSFGGEKLIMGGRFVGTVTGYENGGFTFLFVPILLLLFSQRKRLQILGGLAAIGFLILSVPHAWSRYATVSFLLALSMVAVVKRKRQWPSLAWMGAILLVVALYQLRGHSDWQYGQITGEVARLLDSIPQRTSQVLGSDDTSMLQTWYVSSYLNDEWIGIDYGVPVLNYVLTGWIPSRVLPGKYFMIDWLSTQRSSAYPAILDRLLKGSKSSLLGSFYAHGALSGVLLGALLTGYLSRRLDGMLVGETSPIVKSIAISWLSVAWIVWASSTAWAIMTIGTLAMPALATWLLLPKAARRVQATDQPNREFDPAQAHYLQE